MKTRLCIALNLLSVAVPLAFAIPTGEISTATASVDGTAPATLEAALIDFVFTEKGTLQEIPSPISLGFFPKGKLMVFSPNLHPKGKPMVYQYLATRGSTAELRSGSGEPDAPLDVDELTFEGPTAGSFVNRQTKATGTFTLTQDVFNNPSIIQKLMGERMQQGLPRAGYIPRSERGGRRLERPLNENSTCDIPSTQPADLAPSMGGPAKVVPVHPAGASLPPTVQRPRATDPKAVIYGGETAFNQLFKNISQIADISSLALLYESRVAKPDYMAIGEACFHDFAVAGNDEFRKHQFASRNLEAIEAKLDSAYAPHIIMFGMSGEKVSYDFSRKAYPCLALRPKNTVRGFGGGYGYIIANPQDLLYIPVQPELARVGVVEGGGSTQFSYTFFAVVDGLGSPSMQYPKVVSLRVVGISLMIGKKFIGLYKLSTKELLRHQDGDSDFADSLK